MDWFRTDCAPLDGSVSLESHKSYFRGGNVGFEAFCKELGKVPLLFTQSISSVDGCACFAGSFAEMCSRTVLEKPGVPAQGGERWARPQVPD